MCHHVISSSPAKDLASAGRPGHCAGGETGEPKLPPPPPEPTAAQTDKVAVPESAGRTELALPSSEAPPAPQNSGGGLFSGLFPGTPPLEPDEAALAQHPAVPVAVFPYLKRERGGCRRLGGREGDGGCC